MKRPPVSDPCGNAWLDHCAEECRAGDTEHLPRSRGGEATFATNDEETFCRCGVPGCGWSWSAPKEAA